MHAAETSWRCVGCHGWDYNGRPDQKTGALSAKIGNEPGSLGSILQDDNHLYADKLTKRDVSDLAAFIGGGLADMSSYVETGSDHVAGDAKKEAALYATVCANCHGSSGQKISSTAPLGTVARDRPREAFHKILNGHPAERMPPLRFLGARRIGDLLTYIRTLPAKELSASIARGGRLYDNWMKETGAAAPSSRHPAYPRDAVYASSPITNWRCKECHGWDYKGRDGKYGRGRHRTGIKGMRALAGTEPEKIIALLMDTNHRYHRTRWSDGPLEFQDLIDLANFVSSGQIDMDVYIDPETGTAKGDPRRRKNEFDVLCATCHGKKGDALLTGSDIGDVARENPWEALHKIRNGHPDEAMPALHILDMGTLTDILAYAQTLSNR